MNVRKGHVRSLKYACVFASFAAILNVFGCASMNATKAIDGVSLKVPQKVESSYRALSKRDLNYVIDAKLSRQNMVSYMQKISIEDYSIPDPNTNWMQAIIGGTDSVYSIYYFTYRQRYFILLLQDGKDKYFNCIDVILLPRSSSDYELGMGPVEIDKDHYDKEVVVIFNKRWKGNYSDDIVAAYKPNLKKKRIEEFKYKYIRIYREE